MKKYDFCVMNPPYGDSKNGGMYLDMQFVEKANEICNKQIVIHPAKKWVSNTNIGKKNAESGHLKELEIIDANKTFGLSTLWKYGGIFYYDNTTSYDKTIIVFNEKNINIETDVSYEERRKTYDMLMKPQDLYEVIKSKESLYKTLIEEYGTMVNDGHSFIYEENRLQRGKKRFGVTKTDQIKLYRVKKHLKEGTYKYCVYKNSAMFGYTSPKDWQGEDPDKTFNGQICWLTNKENVKNNLKYWMECTLFDLWRYFYLFDWKMASSCAYGNIPALDFEISEAEFKKYVDSLNDFTLKEIKIMINNKIHNAERL